MRNEWAVRGWLILLLLGLFCCKERPEVLHKKESRLTINRSEVYVKKLAFGTDESQAFGKEPLVVVHGGPLLDHSYFLPYLNELGKHYQLIFYDQRACGLSSAAVDTTRMNLEAFIDDIELLRKELGFEKINLMGHSWGGLLAMKYAIKYTDKLDKLVLSNSMAPSAADWQMESGLVGQALTETDRLQRQEVLKSGDLQSDDPREAVKALLLLSFKRQLYDTSKLSQLEFNIPVDYMKRSELFQLLSPGLGSYDLYDDLAQVTCSTLVIYGESEHALELYTDKMLSALPNARLETINKSGHFPFVERPALFSQTIIDFLAD